MPATALPPLAKLEGAGAVPSSADFRLAQGDLRRYLAGLLGVTGEVIDAVAALGLNKVSGDCLQTRVTATGGGSNMGTTSLQTRSTAPIFTPKSATSQILVKCTVKAYKPSSPNYSLSFGIYQDTAPIGAGFVFDQAVNVVDGAGNFTGDSGMLGGAQINVLHAVISNTGLTPRNFFLKATDSNYVGSIVNCLWEISEYVV